MTGPNFDKHIDALVNKLQDRVKALFAAHDFYSAAADEAGVRDWSEIPQWALLSNLYVRSQVLLIDQMTVKRPGQPSLFKTIEYASHRPHVFARKEHPNVTRDELGRVTVGVFSAEEATADLRKVHAARKAIAFMGDFQQPDQSLEAFKQRIRNGGGSPEAGFRLPEYPEIELAIDAIFELWLKYCEIILGRNYSRIANVPRLPAIGRLGALSSNWGVTQFDPHSESRE
ncbi:MAG: hypothetical protein HYX29_11760 [Solirubrobacterales bacterium]|nr:hypothetical protein [Solirubrobacterales bacterium]